MRRGLSLALALGLGAALVFLSPFSDRPLTPHMADHLLLGDLAPLLAAFALPRGRVRAVPAVASWVATRAVWHVSAVFDAAVRHPALHALEHLSLYAGGLAVAAVVVDASCAPPRGSAAWPSSRSAG